MNHRNPNPAYFEALAKARGVQLPLARSWSILLTSANHGTVGPVGSTFPHAGEKHERVQVMEIVEAGAPPAPDVDLAGLVRITIDGTVIPLAAPSAPVGVSTVLTDERISEALDRARLNTDSHCESLASEPSKEYSDAYFFLQIQREVAAQAGQVAVPEFDLYMRSRIADLLHLLQFATISTPSHGDADQAKLVMADIRRNLAKAAPSPAKGLK